MRLRSLAATLLLMLHGGFTLAQNNALLDKLGIAESSFDQLTLFVVNPNIGDNLIALEAKVGALHRRYPGKKIRILGPAPIVGLIESKLANKYKTWLSLGKYNPLKTSDPNLRDYMQGINDNDSGRSTWNTWTENVKQALKKEEGPRTKILFDTSETQALSVQLEWPTDPKRKYSGRLARPDVQIDQFIRKINFTGTGYYDLTRFEDVEAYSTPYQNGTALSDTNKFVLSRDSPLSGTIYDDSYEIWSRIFGGTQHRTDVEPFRILTPDINSEAEAKFSSSKIGKLVGKDPFFVINMNTRGDDKVAGLNYNKRYATTIIDAAKQILQTSDLVKVLITLPEATISAENKDELDRFMNLPENKGRVMFAGEPGDFKDPTKVDYEPILRRAKGVITMDSGFAYIANRLMDFRRVMIVGGWHGRVGPSSDPRYWREGTQSYASLLGFDPDESSKSAETFRAFAQTRLNDQIQQSIVWEYQWKGSPSYLSAEFFLMYRSSDPAISGIVSSTLDEALTIWKLDPQQKDKILTAIKTGKLQGAGPVDSWDQLIGKLIEQGDVKTAAVFLNRANAFDGRQKEQIGLRLSILAQHEYFPGSREFCAMGAYLMRPESTVADHALEAAFTRRPGATNSAEVSARTMEPYFATYRKFFSEYLENQLNRKSKPWSSVDLLISSSAPTLEKIKPLAAIEDLNLEVLEKKRPPGATNYSWGDELRPTQASAAKPAVSESRNSTLSKLTGTSIDIVKKMKGCFIDATEKVKGILRPRTPEGFN